MTELKTIRQVAKLGILPEFRLRTMQKQNQLPGFHCGNKFMVNVGLLVEQIERQSRAQVDGGNDAQ